MRHDDASSVLCFFSSDDPEFSPGLYVRSRTYVLVARAGIALAAKMRCAIIDAP